MASKTTRDSLEYLGDEDPFANPPEMYETMREAALDGLDECAPKETTVSDIRNAEELAVVLSEKLDDDAPLNLHSRWRPLAAELWARMGLEIPV